MGNLLPTPLPNLSLLEYGQLVTEITLKASRLAKTQITYGNKAAADRILKDGIQALLSITVFVADSIRICPTNTTSADISAALGRIAVGPVFAGLAGQSKSHSKQARYRKWNRKLKKHATYGLAGSKKDSKINPVTLYHERTKIEHRAWDMITRLRRIRKKLLKNT